MSPPGRCGRARESGRVGSPSCRDTRHRPPPICDRICGSLRRMPPSRQHELIAWAVPRLRSPATSTRSRRSARLERWHDQLDRSLPTRVVPGFHRRFAVVVETLTGRGRVPGVRRHPARDRPGADRGPRARRRLRGAAGPVPRAVRDTAGHRAAGAGGAARLPAGAPEHSWRDSHAALVDLVARWAAKPGQLVLAGDSAGGGLALALALSLRDRGARSPTAWCCTRRGRT